MHGVKPFWRWMPFTVFSIALLVARLAAAELPEALPEARQSVEIIAAGDRPTTLALQARLLPWLDARDVRLGWSFRTSIEPREVLARQAPEFSLLARIWLDLRSSTRAILYVVDTRGDRFLVRVLSVPGGYDEVARESLGNILESTLDALLLGGEVGLSRASATAQVERELGSLDDPSRDGTDVATFEVATADTPDTPLPGLAPLSEEAVNRAPAHSVGLFDAILLGASVDTLRDTEALRVAPQLSTYIFGATPAALAVFGGLSAGYSLPATWSGAEAGVELHGPSLRLLGGVRRRGLGATWRAAAGVGVELLHVSPRAYHNDARPVDAFWIASPLLCGRLAFEPELTDRWFLSFALGADLDLAGHHFDIDRAGTRSTVLQPWRVRPVALVALGFSAPRDPFSSPPLQP